MDAVQETEYIQKITQIEQHLKFYYYPAISVVSADLLMSTEEIYLKMQGLFPCAHYFSNDIINIMTKLGYKMVDMGAMDYQWIMRYEMQ